MVQRLLLEQVGMRGSMHPSKRRPSPSGCLCPTPRASCPLPGRKQVSDVRPLLTVATYLDDQTGFEIYQEVGGVCAQALPLERRALGSDGYNQG